MPTLKFGESEPIAVREVWPSEADFTTWLAENMDLLSKEIGLKLNLIQEEAWLAPSSDWQGRVDILAREGGSGDYVVIENQMEESDNDHFAGVLNYASHSDSRILILVASRIGDCHRRTMDWLNEGNGVRIYGVEMSARRNGNSIERRLELVAGPDKRSEWPKFEYPPEKQKYLDFFRPLVAEMVEQDIADRNTARPVNDQEFPSGHSAIHYHVGFWGGGNSVLSIYLYIATFDPDRNKRIVNALHQHRQEIEEALPEVWWGSGNGQNEAVVGISIPGSIEDPEEGLGEIRAWASENIPKFKAVIQPCLEQVISESQPNALGQPHESHPPQPRPLVS